MAGISGFRAAVSAVLSLAILLTGCSSSGGTVLFASPEGGRVRIGSGRSHAIPWETRLELGSHPIEIRARRPRDGTGLSPRKVVVRGWLVVLDTWSDRSEFEPSEQAWADATNGSELRLAGSAAEWWAEPWRFKGRVGGVPEDDPEVLEWADAAAEKLARTPPSATLEVLEAIGMGILYVLAFVFIVVVEALADNLDEDCVVE